MDGRNHWSMDQPTARILWGLESQLKGLSHEATNSIHDLTSLGDVFGLDRVHQREKKVFYFIVFFCCCWSWLNPFFFFVVVGWVVKDPLPMLLLSRLEPVLVWCQFVYRCITNQVWGRCLSRKHLHDIGRHTCFQHICPVQLQWARKPILYEKL